MTPSEPGISPSAIAEPIISDDEDEREAQACSSRDESQRHGPHMPEGHNIVVRGCQHVLHLRLVVLFDGKRLLQG